MDTPVLRTVPKSWLQCIGRIRLLVRSIWRWQRCYLMSKSVLSSVHDGCIGSVSGKISFPCHAVCSICWQAIFDRRCFKGGGCTRSMYQVVMCSGIFQRQYQRTCLLCSCAGEIWGISGSRGIQGGRMYLCQCYCFSTWFLSYCELETDVSSRCFDLWSISVWCHGNGVNIWWHSVL